MSYFRERIVAGGGNGLRLRHDDPIALAFVGAIRAGDLARSSATPSGCISDSRSVYAWWRPRRAAQPANWKMSRRFWREQAQANPGTAHLNVEVVNGPDDKLALIVSDATGNSVAEVDLDDGAANQLVQELVAESRRPAGVWPAFGRGGRPSGAWANTIVRLNRRAL